MSVGLLRVLVQKKLVPQENLAKYQEAIKKEKPILPLVFSDKIITPDALAQLCSDVFNYPMLDLNFFPRSRIVPDVLTEEQMQELRCIPLHKRGKTVCGRFRSDQSAKYPKGGFQYRFVCGFGCGTR